MLKAIQHQETDFVPYNFHAVPGVWQKVCRHYGLKDTHEAVEFIGNHIVKVGSDFNYNPWADDVGRVELTVSGGPVRTALDEAGGLHRDEFGCVWDPLWLRHWLFRCPWVAPSEIIARHWLNSGLFDPS